ncbi:hypothetical protein HK097_002699 [Rhizophlyctis rosea]|uniref:ABC-2 type transporter transmembrane domain-containing protein n=1 Tax=Rhizophlyctis rosea TaxID=64517 RepID=A0AAD5S551_9FUNG|nr:hypothetical protein HK097_002699 [Rhizophlyctis rosea]
MSELKRKEREAKNRKRKMTSDYYRWTDYVAHGLATVVREWGSWVWDILKEIGAHWMMFFYFVTCKKDPVRETCGLHIQLWLLIKRSGKQVYRTVQSFLFDQALHLGCGIFISIATQNFRYKGTQPTPICQITPLNLQWRCYAPEDYLTQAGMFIVLGCLFAGISVGSGTFGRERVVFWRDTAAGMRATPYFLAKFLVDIPRIVIGAGMYTIALILFFPYRQKFIFILVLVEFMYFVAFAMGYFLSIVFRPKQVPLVGTGFALLWALVLSGVMPNLQEVTEDTTYAAVRWLWEISAPRWAIEAFWLKEVAAYPYADKDKDPPYTYKWSEYNPALSHILLIATVWNLIAFLSLKLKDRTKQK